MTEMKKYVRIKKATREAAWYADKIGQIFEVECVGPTYLIRTGPNHLSAIRKEDAELIITENRRPKVGERVLITNGITSSGDYKTGDICTVLSVGDIYGTITVKEHGIYVVAREYEVIVNNEVKNEEADGMENAYIRKQSDGLDRIAKSLGYVELAKSSLKQNGFIGEVHTFDLLTECAEKLREQAQSHKEKIERGYPECKSAPKSAQARRDEIVEQAKADVERLKENNIRLRTFNISLEVNRKDRSVEAIAKRPKSNRAFYGIAKAAPSDCFNVHIGKAIAIRRALGLAVPDEYLNAPQPTEVRVGDVIMPSVLKKNTPRKVVATDVEVDAIANVCCLDSIMATNNATIIDDSREEVIGE
ncbi:hypothetical protein [Bacillus velezensis]|uniref:hypothetical protein n=1 Tax=Bacillus velezensis TaxID=492670 RepID=UPI002DB970A0|nr:hypothetical protein [Bacillus velezensis]MEC1940339.1 hypothetical protein [Bacillus velezensis]